jgi:hypothetical protein
MDCRRAPTAATDSLAAADDIGLHYPGTRGRKVTEVVKFNAGVHMSNMNQDSDKTQNVPGKTPSQGGQQNQQGNKEGQGGQQNQGQRDTGGGQQGGNQDRNKKEI